MRVLGTLARHLALAAALACTGISARAGDGRELALALAADGTLTATGVLPRDLSAEELSAALPGVDVSGIDRARTAPEWGVEPALDALSIVLPRFRTATVSLQERTLEIRGELNSGLSARGAEAALRAALGTGWRIDLQASETAPAAEIVVMLTGEGVVVSGLLPGELGPPEALKLVGEPASGFGLAGGGDGGAQGWPEALAALGETIDVFASATARVAAGEVAIEGVLRPGYPSDAVANRLGERLPTGWGARVAAEETPPSEGDRRVSLATGEAESFRRGYWLPEVSFPVSPDRCRAETDAALAGEGLPFVDGEAVVEKPGLALLDRLAAVAVRCLNSSALQLEIGGHTDSVGNDAQNEALSLARAEAVQQALVDRGVRAEAVTARGFGESRPVATNNTPEGRAQNRRIVFQWSEPGG